MKSVSHHSWRWLFWTLALVGLALDLGSKYLVFGLLYNEGKGDRVQVIGGVFSLTAEYKEETDAGVGVLGYLRTINGKYLPQVNQGALFGMGQGNNFFFTLISLAAAVGIVWWNTRFGKQCEFLLSVSLGLILAGTLGNLYDRIVFDGVRDFLHWYYETGGHRHFDWPVFNIADCCLVCGACLLLMQAFFFQSKSAEDAAVTQSEQVGKENEIVEVQ